MKPILFAILTSYLCSFSSTVVLAADTPGGKHVEIPIEAKQKTASTDSDKKRNVDGISDNSFLIEEAYNQEEGVVQHVITATRGIDRANQKDKKSWDLSFSQEWPIGSEKHQFSYTIPYGFETGGDGNNGFHDISFQYRYQLLKETDHQPAFAPRIGVILPTGNSNEDFGSDTYGFQYNLPFSKAVTDKIHLHFNAGQTYLPDVDRQLTDQSRSPRYDLMGYNLGASIIYAAFPKFHYMLEATTNWDKSIDEDTGMRNEDFSAVISPGVRYAIDSPSGAQIVFGIGAPIGLSRDATDYGVFLYFSLEHGFGKKD